MFHKAVGLKFLSGTLMEVTFQDGQVKHYDMATLFAQYPQLCALQDPALFRSGRLMGGYGIVWNEDLDIEAETIYQDGSLFAGFRLQTISWPRPYQPPECKAA